MQFPVNPDRKNTLWVFGSQYWRQVGIGGLGFGYLRLAVSRPKQWRDTYYYSLLDSLRARRFMDNQYGSFWQGFAWSPFGFRAFSFRWYRFIATHITVCGVTLSYVNDHERMGPIGAVYGILPIFADASRAEVSK